MTNQKLPINAFRDEIVGAVRNNPVVVITAETGAGKSTQVPQYLLDEGYDLVVTQPRRLAARTVAQRVAEEIGETLGGIVGYRTAVDRQDSPSTRALFCTDGLALVASIAPMLGLLGTVVGINGAFATISSADGFSRPDQLAGDISLALVTTIMGLVLAIPATSAVTYFRNRIEKLAADIAVVVDELAIYLETPAGPAPQPAQAPTRPFQPAQTQPPPQPAGPSATPQTATRPIGRASRPDAPEA